MFQDSPALFLLGSVRFPHPCSAPQPDTSNPRAVGARVQALSGKLTQTKEVYAGRGYQSHFGTRQHFGFGPGTAECTIKVRWPDGTWETFPVKLDGELKPKLLVTFTPTNKGPIAVGTTNEKGEFRVTTGGRVGAVEGEHKVSITTVFEADNTTAPQINSTAPSGGDAYINQGQIKSQEFKIPKETIPARYNTQTELIRTVGSGETNFNFALSTAPAGK